MARKKSVTAPGALAAVAPLGLAPTLTHSGRHLRPEAKMFQHARWSCAR
jgi:hypothetical protein